MISSFYEKIVGTSVLKDTKPKILCVGLACLDIIQTCKSFPTEDSDTRCIEYRWQRGGNASNNSTILSKLGSQCEFLGTLGAEHHLKFIKDDMIKNSIDFSHCPVIEGVGIPISTVILSLTTGSRTILHHNPNLPELNVEDLEQLNLEEYSWIHFEGRNITRVLGMMQLIENYNNKLKITKPNQFPITISVELEKTHSELLDLLPYADVAFISKDFARSRGYHNMSETIKNIARDVKSGATIICAWGDRGAMARTPDGTIVQSPAFPPPQIVDSLGAGDTFTAAILHCLNYIKLRDQSKVIEKSKQVQLNEHKVIEDKVISNKEDNKNNKNYNEQKQERNTDFQEQSPAQDIQDIRHNKDIEAINDIKDNKKNNKDEMLHQKIIIEHNYNIESSEYSKTEFINNSILHSAVMFACRTAGAKIGFKGYEGLKRDSLEFLDDL